jgi:hypothetical protein
VSAGVRTTRARHESRSRCDDCDVLHPQATPGRVRQHVKNTGHTVRRTTEHVTVYGPAETEN